MGSARCLWDSSNRAAGYCGILVVVFVEINVVLFLVLNFCRFQFLFFVYCCQLYFLML